MRKLLPLLGLLLFALPAAAQISVVIGQPDATATTGALGATGSSGRAPAAPTRLGVLFP